MVDLFSADYVLRSMDIWSLDISTKLTLTQANVPLFLVPLFKVSIGAGGPGIWSLTSIAHQAVSVASFAAMTCVEVMSGIIIVR